jgi:hypothetical protein
MVAAEWFTRRTAARIVNVTSHGQLVIEMLRANHNAKFETVLAEPEIRSYLVVYCDGPLWG